MEVKQWLDVLFGPGDDSYPFWLTTVRLNVLLFLACVAGVAVWTLAAARSRNRSDKSPSIPFYQWGMSELYAVLALTALATLLRFAVAGSNLMDFGGIPYSRLLFGYKGYFATAQFFSPFYQLSARDIEHAIFFDRIAGTLTIPIVYFLCRRLAPGNRLYPAIAAFLFAVYPPHILFSASDVLAIFSIFLAATSYLLLAAAVEAADRRAAAARYLGGFAGLVLLTQVRYENVLLLIPPAFFLFARRRVLVRRELFAPVLVVAVFGAIYAYEAVTSGLSFRNPVDLQRGLDLTVEHLILNPFFALPILFIGALAIPLRGSLRLGALALLPWIAGLLLCVGAAEDGHGTARIFTNWLVLILPSAAYGFSLLYGARLLLARAAAVLALLYLGALPLVTYHRLAARYLEILENDRFKALLANLPDGVERIIVPDDEITWRRHHSTLEVYRKYQAILWGQRHLPEIRLISLTRYLDSPEEQRCSPGGCLFFAGLPCMEGLMFPETREQCTELLRLRQTSVLEDATVVAAPFVSCSIYVGEIEEQLCDPATAPRRFVTYRVEG